jgi:DNA polymerase-3 subunit alpha
MFVVDRAVQAAVSAQRDKARGQMSLFGEAAPSADASGAPAAEETGSIPPADDWTHSQKLGFEKEVFGFYLTSHPLTEFADQLESFTQQTVKDLRDLGDGKEVVVGGMIGAIKKAQTKKPSRNGNSKYVNFDLEDAHGVVRCILWPDDFAREGEKIKAEAIVVVKGRTDARGREPNLIVNKIMTLDDAAKEYTRQVAIKFVRGYHTEEDMKRVRDVLSRFPGKTPVVLVLETWPENGAKGAAANGGEDGSENAFSADAVAGAGSNRLRAYLTTSQHVSARGELRTELVNILGQNSLRFQTESANG